VEPHGRVALSHPLGLFLRCSSLIILTNSLWMPLEGRRSVDNGLSAFMLCRFTSAHAIIGVEKCTQYAIDFKCTYLYCTMIPPVRTVPVCGRAQSSPVQMEGWTGLDWTTDYQSWTGRDRSGPVHTHLQIRHCFIVKYH